MKVRLTIDIDVPGAHELQLGDLASSYFIAQYGSADVDYTSLDLFEQAINDVIMRGDFADFLSTIGFELVTGQSHIEEIT